MAPLFITLDPARDSAAVVRDYAAQFSPAILPLRGTPQATAAAMRAFRLQSEKYQATSEIDYQLDHPALFFLLDPQGRYLRTLSSNLPPAELAKELRASFAARQGGPPLAP